MEKEATNEENTTTTTRENNKMDISQLEAKSKDELMELAKEMELSDYVDLTKQDLTMRLLQAEAEQQGNIFCSGILEIMPDGYGFLRQSSLLPSSSDIYVSQSQIRRFGLRVGDMVAGQGRPARAGEKYYSLLRIEAVNDINPELAKGRPYFGSLTPTFPDQLVNLEVPNDNLSTRLLNLIAPIGRGQRGLIVSPPKAGKTILLKSIANAVNTNYDDIHIMVCLIGERPEEVTDMKRSVKGDVISATFDEPVENHTRVAELAQERAKRLGNLQEGEIHIDLQHVPVDGGGELTVRFEDSGEGFDYLADIPKLEENVGHSGRGIQLVRSRCSQVNYQGAGNIAEVVYCWQQSTS